MSHKVAAPGPFPGSTVIVDANSTSQTEDGSWQNPFKTIQAAMDAFPTPTGLADSFWTVSCVPAVYLEDVVLPTFGIITLTSAGGPGTFVVLGDGSTVGSLIWSAEDPGSITSGNRINLSNIAITRNFVVATTNLGTKQASLNLKDVEISGVILSTDVAVPAFLRWIMNDVFVTGGIDIDGILTGQNNVFSGNVSYRGGGDPLYDTSFGGDIIVSVGLANLNRCSISGDTTFSGGANLRDVQINGEMDISGGTTNELMDVKVGVAATLTNILRLENCLFQDTVTIEGSKPRIQASVFEGLFTAIDSAFNVAYSSTFSGGVTLDHVPTHGFFGCSLSGVFTGPAGSFRVDGITNQQSISNVTLTGGATADVLGQGGSGAAPITFPYQYDNSSGDLAFMDVNGSDNGWSSGTLGILFSDGVNTKVIGVENINSGQTADVYDNGGGLGWNAGVFSIVLELNVTAADLTISPVWEKLTYGPANFGYGFSVGDNLYLSNSTGRNDLAHAEALNAAAVFTPVAGDDFIIEGVSFEGVSGSADPAAQEYDVDAGSAALVVASLVATINNPASQALLTTATGGATVTAYSYTGGFGAAHIFVGSGGVYDLTLNFSGSGFSLSSWGNMATAIVVTPGNNIA